jgi:hypothetical protein
VIKRSKIRRPVAVAAPSRIRREPPGRVPEPLPRIDQEQRELWTVAIGVVLFSIAIAIITFGFSAITGS